ncbi:MAG: class I SAM-dependent methyltransferase [Bacteroidales bacterium]|nr:class I SAM-dependent methyltransferase [Bacteroidales bacterium]
MKGDSQAIEFSDGTFDVAMCGLRVRNFEDTLTGLRENVQGHQTRRDGHGS